MVRIRRCPVHVRPYRHFLTSVPVLCSKAGLLHRAPGGRVLEEHSTATLVSVCFFCFFPLCFEAIFSCVLQKYIHRVRHVAVTAGMRGGMRFRGSGSASGPFAFRPHVERQTPQHRDHRYLITDDLVCFIFLRCSMFSILKLINKLVGE